MMRLFRCPQCKENFGSAVALGGGWVGLKCVLGCPRCSTFIARSAFLPLLGVTLGLLNLCFGGPYTVFTALAQNDNGKLLAGIVSMVLGLSLIYGNTYAFKKNVRGDRPIHSDWSA